jgi:hypothetical protein
VSHNISIIHSLTIREHKHMCWVGLGALAHTCALASQTGSPFSLDKFDPIQGLHHPAKTGRMLQVPSVRLQPRLKLPCAGCTKAVAVTTPASLVHRLVKLTASWARHSRAHASSLSA